MYHSIKGISNVLFPSLELSSGYYSSQFIELLELMKNQNMTLDLLACNLNYEGFKDEMARLSQVYGVTIRYSLDETGNTPNGDWILESHNADVKSVYFNENISNFTEILFTVWGKDPLYEINLNASGEFAHVPRDYDGNRVQAVYDKYGNLLKFPQSSINSSYTTYDSTITNAVAIVHNMGAACAMLADGSVELWGHGILQGTYGGKLAYGTGLTSSQISSITNVISVYPSQRGFCAKKSNGDFIIWGNGAFDISVPDMSGETLRYAVAADDGNNAGTYWGFYLVTDSGKLVHAIMDTTNNTLLDESSVSNVYHPTNNSDMQSGVVNVKCAFALKSVGVLKSNGDFYAWGSQSGNVYRSGVASFVQAHSSFALIYSDGSAETVGQRSQSKASLSAYLNQGSVTGEVYEFIMTHKIGMAFMTNKGQIVTTQTMYGHDVQYGFSLTGTTNETNIASLTTALASDPPRRVYSTQGFVMVLTEGYKAYAIGMNRYNSLTTNNYKLMFANPVSNVNSYFTVRTDGSVYLIDIRYGTETPRWPNGPSTTFSGFGIFAAHQRGTIAYYANGRSICLDSNVKSGGTTDGSNGAYHSVVYYSTDIGGSIFALINSSQSIDRGIAAMSQAVSDSDTLYGTRYGGLTESQVQAGIGTLAGVVETAGTVYKLNRGILSGLKSVDSYNDATNYRARMKKFAQELRTKASTAGISQDMVEAYTSDVPVTDFVTKSKIRIVTSTNLTVELEDLGNEAVYAPLDTVGDFLRVNNGSSYVKITTTGDDDFELNLSGSVTSNVSAGQTGTHARIMYEVGSGTAQAEDNVICFLEGSMVDMYDGSKRAIQDVKEGDVVLTQNGKGVVRRLWQRRVHNAGPAVPYKVGDVMMSGNHLVYVDGEMKRADSVGERVVLQDKYVRYYHIKTDGGVGDLLSVGGVWCESWDGHVYGEDMLKRSTFVLSGLGGEMHRMVVRGVRE